jgi:hypothetical protein
METQENLENIGIGTKEETKLEPGTVKIVKASVETVGEKGKAKKVVCEVKHPNSENTIKISAVKYEVKGKLSTTGLWFNQDADNLIKKNSALAMFLRNLNIETIAGLTDKEVATVEDENGYLVFKAY